MYECQVCKQFARLTLKEIIRHIRDMHRHFSSPVRCGIHNCPSTATSYESLRQHMYKKHRNELIPDHEDYNSNYPTSTETAAVHDRGHDVSHDGQRDDDHDHDRDGDVANDVDISIAEVNDNPHNMSQSTIETAKFILKIRDGKGLTQTVTGGILRDMQTVVECTTDNLKAKVIKALNSLNKLSSSEIDNIKGLFSPEKMIFTDLDTQYKQENFFQDHFNYVVRCVCAYVCVVCQCVCVVCVSVDVLCVRVWMCTCTDVYAFAWVHGVSVTHTHASIHTHTHTHACTHTCTHTHTYPNAYRHMDT